MKVSVVIPVGPGHGVVVRDAVDSVAAQTYPDVECIVVNDCGDDIAFARIRVLHSKERNVAAARNIGIRASTGEAFVCLDADDVLAENFVERTVEVCEPNAWVYTDCYLEDEEGVSEMQAAKDWNVETLWRSGISYVTCLYPKVAWQYVGGFDETIGHEDWEFHLRLANAGLYGVHLAEPLVTYRRWLSLRSKAQQTDKSRAVIQKRYLLAALAPNKVAKEEREWPVLVYTGSSQREVILNGREVSYKVNKNNSVVSVHPSDVPYFLGMGIFRFAEKGELEPKEGNMLHNLGLGAAL